MNRLRAFLDRLPGGHRPPTGPLTTEEESDAEELRQSQKAPADEQQVEHKPDE